MLARLFLFGSEAEEGQTRLMGQRGNGGRLVWLGQLVTVAVVLIGVLGINQKVNDLEGRQRVLHVRLSKESRDIKELFRTRQRLLQAIRQVVRDHLRHQLFAHPVPAYVLARFRKPRYCLGRRITMYGTKGTDFLTGTPKADVIAGLGSGDSIFGDGGNDRLCGNGGNDVLVGDPGNDRTDGGRGNDECVAEHKRRCEQ